MKRNPSDERSPGSALPAIHRIVLWSDSAFPYLSLQEYLEGTATLYIPQEESNVLEAFHQPGAFALVLMDMEKLSANQFALLQRIRAVQPLEQTPMVVISIHPEKNDYITLYQFEQRQFDLRDMTVPVLAGYLREMLSEMQIKPVAMAESTRARTVQKLSIADIEWLQLLDNEILQHLSDPSFSVSRLGFYLHMSESTLARKIHQLLGMTPGQYITQLRMQRARSLLETRRYQTVNQVAAAVGFRHAGAFSRCFHLYFGETPMSILKSSATLLAMIVGEINQLISEHGHWLVF
jgi:AraC-like DNA-binding protein